MAQEEAEVRLKLNRGSNLEVGEGGAWRGQPVNALLLL